jgi:hypothetical protein
MASEVPRNEMPVESKILSNDAKNLGFCVAAEAEARESWCSYFDTPRSKKATLLSPALASDRPALFGYIEGIAVRILELVLRKGDAIVRRNDFNIRFDLPQPLLG